MIKYIYNIIFISFFNSIIYAQIGINIKDESASLSIMENNLNSIQDTILLRTSNSFNLDKFQLKTNGNLTLFNSLMLNNNPGEVGNVLVSNGNSTQQIWTNSVKKGVEIQVFNAIQDALLGKSNLF